MDAAVTHCEWRQWEVRESVDRMCVFVANSHLVTFDLPLSDLRKFLSTKINATLPSLLAFSLPLLPPFFLLSLFLSFPFSPLISAPFTLLSIFYPFTLFSTAFFYTLLLLFLPTHSPPPPLPLLLLFLFLSPLPLLSFPHHLLPIRCDTLT